VLDNLGRFAGGALTLDEAVHASAQSDPKKLQAEARDLAGDGGLADYANATVDLYLKQGSVAVTARQLAVMAATLANDGVNPLTRDAAVKPVVAQNVVQLISQAGLRGGRSSALNKGMLIATSGSSGAILVVVPGRLGIAVYAPPLDASGVSVRGQLALRYLDQALMLDGDPSRP
jgi:glutaminase